MEVKVLLHQREKLQLTQPSMTPHLELYTPMPENLFSSLAKKAWLLVPKRLRAVVYGVLWGFGSKLYGPTSSTHRLPFGLCLKYLKDSELLTNEFEALRLIESVLLYQLQSLST